MSRYEMMIQKSQQKCSRASFGISEIPFNVDCQKSALTKEKAKKNALKFKMKIIFMISSELERFHYTLRIRVNNA